MRDFQNDLRRIAAEKRNAVCYIRKDAELLNAIKRYCMGRLIENGHDINEKAYWFLAGLEAYPICQCPGCQVKTTFRGIRHGYAVACCSRHAAIVSRPKAAKTNLEKYGSTTPLQNAEIRAEINRRNIEKYGVANVVESEHFKRKRIETCQGHFGVDFPMQSKRVQAKSKASCRKKYGADYAVQNKTIRGKAISSCRKSLGVDFPMQSDVVKQKARSTMLEKYGITAPAQCPEIRRKQQAKYRYLGMSFDSFPEIAYFIWLYDRNENFEYQPNVSFTYEFNMETHFYMPDFRIGNDFIEIKGDHFFKPDGTMRNPYDSGKDELYEAKRRCMVENNVKIIKTSELKEIIAYAKAKLRRLELSVKAV